MTGVRVVNFSERHFTARMWFFQFGAYADTRLLVWGDSLEGALETAAEWLVDHAPGQLVASGSPEETELFREALGELGYTGPLDCVWSEEPELAEKAEQAAFVDMTLTEAGWIPSWEWWASEVTRADLRKLRGRS